MNDTVCFYQFADSKETGYFLMENNISFQQLVDFMRNSKIIDESFTIEVAETKEALDDKNLAELIAQAVSLDSPVQITLRKIGSPFVCQESVVESEVIPEPVVQQRNVVGPTIKSILTKVGVKVEEDALNDVQQLIKSLPFPFSFLFNGYLDQVLKNEDNLKTIVQQVAAMFEVDQNALLEEASFAVEFLKNGKNEEILEESSKIKKEEQKENIEEEIQIPLQNVEELNNKQERSLFGPVITSILSKHFAIEQSSINSAEREQKILKTNPLLRFLATIEEEQIEFYSQKIAPRFSVDPEKFCEEYKYIKQTIPKSENKEACLFRGGKWGQRFVRKCQKIELNENERLKCPKMELNGNERIKSCHSLKNRVNLQAKGVKYHTANCDECKTRISGIRYYCLHCKNYDLCSSCEQKNTDAPFHDESHIFAKVTNARTPYRILDHLNAQSNPPHSTPIDGPMGSYQRLRRRETEQRIIKLETSLQELKDAISQLQQ